MKAEKFNEILRWRLAKTEKVLASKAGEYASSEDRLHNFKEAAAMLRCTPAQALLGFMTKHMVSIYDLVLSDATPSHETWDEKIGDAVNYLVLLEALVKEPLMVLERTLAEMSKAEFVIEPDGAAEFREAFGYEVEERNPLYCNVEVIDGMPCGLPRGHDLPHARGGY